MQISMITNRPPSTGFTRCCRETRLRARQTRRPERRDEVWPLSTKEGSRRHRHLVRVGTEPVDSTAARPAGQPPTATGQLPARDSAHHRNSILNYASTRTSTNDNKQKTTTRKTRTTESSSTAFGRRISKCGAFV